MYICTYACQKEMPGCPSKLESVAQVLGARSTPCGEPAVENASMISLFYWIIGFLRGKTVPGMENSSCAIYFWQCAGQEYTAQLPKF